MSKKKSITSAVFLLMNIKTVVKQNFEFAFKNRHREDWTLDYALDRLYYYRNVLTALEILKECEKSTNQGTKESPTAG